jgi:integrase
MGLSESMDTVSMNNSVDSIEASATMGSVIDPMQVEGALAVPQRLPVELEAALARVRRYSANTRAENTVRAYDADWRDFTTWCDSHNLETLPAHPVTVALYLDALIEAGRSVSTLARRLAAIAVAHRRARLDNPATDGAVREAWIGIRRQHGTAQVGKDPLLVDLLRTLVATLDDDLTGRRDRALLLIGFAGALRRAELVALTTKDIRFDGQGLIVTIRRAKTDQQGAGRRLRIPHGARESTCPVRALRAWLAIAEMDTTGAAVPLFRPIDRWGNLRPTGLTSQSVALIVKRAVEAARGEALAHDDKELAAALDPDRFAGHSLRAGLATSAAIAGATEGEIMDQTGHKSVAMVRRYIRDARLSRPNVVKKVGL